MATSKSSERLRYRYGICLNDGCSKCKAKEVQEIPARKEFVCAECGKALRECPPPKTWMQKNGKFVYGGIGALVVAGGIIAALTMGGGEKEVAESKAPVETADTLKKDTAKVGVPHKVEEPKKEEAKPEKPQEPVKTTPAPAAPQNGYGTVNLGYGKYTGDLKNGKPHGHGTITYTRSQKIVASKDFVANPGDKFEGDFRDGRVSGGMGYWYHDGEVTGVKP